MTERMEALLQEALEALTIFLRHENEEYRRAELKRQAEFLREREKQELSEHDC